MSAQPGDSIVLNYGAQGAQREGSFVLLDYALATGAQKIRVFGSTRNAWASADHKRITTKGPYRSAEAIWVGAGNPWVTATPEDVRKAGPFGITTPTDIADTLPWRTLPLEDQLSPQHTPVWRGTEFRDRAADTEWGQYDELLDADHFHLWVASIARDALRKAPWADRFSPKRYPVSLARPSWNAVNFSVPPTVKYFDFAGQPPYTPPHLAKNATWEGRQAYTRPSVSTADAAFDPATLPYPPPVTVDFSWRRAQAYAAPPNARTPANRARPDFLYDPQYITLTDENGDPIFDKDIVDTGRLVPWGDAVKGDDSTLVPWDRYNRRVDSGTAAPTPPGIPQPEPGQTITIPVRRMYIVLNETDLIRVSSGTPIKTLSMSISFDVDSWLPSFTATIPESERSAVMPDPSPVEVMALVNDVQFSFLIERIGRSRQFAQSTVTIAGRGVACELDGPYAPASQHNNASEMTAQQIIQAALGFSGYTQTWSATDWLVPANTFSMYGTPAQVATEVAGAAGLVLQADWFTRDLRVMPRYPTLPWQWAAEIPEYSIPGAVAETEGLEWVEKPGYNVVYVSGAENGILGQVKITGTAGDKPAQMITHPLITHVDAARQRGMSVLGDTGRKAMLQIAMPVLAETGVIDVCRLIEFDDGTTTRRGLVRANQIDVRFPTVRQTLTVETTE